MVRVTESQTFKRCKKKWYYSYVEKLVPKDRNKGASFFGSGIHLVLESFYFAKTQGVDMTLGAMKDVWNEYCDTHLTLADELSAQIREEETTLAYGMLASYIDEKQDEDFEILEVEKRLHWEVFPGVTLTGKMDLIVRIGDELWIVDHKTQKSYTGEEQLEMDNQMSAYIWLARKNGYDVKGCIYNMMLKSIPSEVPILKNGQLSQNKALNTTYDKYMQAIKDNDLKPENYVEMLEYMKANQFVKQSKVFRSKRYLETWEDNLKLEMEELAYCVNTYPNVRYDCTWDCGYKDLCRCELDKGDVPLLQDLYYEVDTELENVEVINACN
jgi:RecB family exonuclease